MSRLRVPTQQLKIGMCVVDLDRPWTETPFLFQGFVLATQADIEAVREYCRYVYIDPERESGSKKLPIGFAGRKRRDKESKAKQQRSIFSLLKRQSPAPFTKSVEEELPQAQKSHARTSSLIRDLMDDVRLGNGLNTKAVKNHVSECVDSVLRNPDAMMWLTQLEQRNKRVADHALNCCILSIAFGRYLGLPRDELENLGACGLLHDVGKLRLPQELLSKSSFDQEDNRVMRQHPNKGKDILMAASELYRGVVDVAQSHHERMDGSGYPRGLKGNQISPYTRMVMIVDTYDDITSHTTYHLARTPFEALRELNKYRGTLFDEQLVHYFIDMVGVFPIGSVVDLSDGSRGVVISSVQKKPARPKILIVRDAHGAACKERVVNLAQPVNHALTIQRVLRADQHDIDLAELKAKGLPLRTV